jgi:hypothetical protein
MTDQDWISFDVRARDSAAAAHVAMWLRERLPEATIKSAPDDLVHQEVLHCDVTIPDRTAAQTERAVKAALRALPDVDGPDAAAQVDFGGIGRSRAA